MKSKKAIESLSITTEIVLPNDTNNLDNLLEEDFCIGWILQLQLLHIGIVEEL